MYHLAYRNYSSVEPRAVIVRYIMIYLVVKEIGRRQWRSVKIIHYLHGSHRPLAKLDEFFSCDRIKSAKEVKQRNTKKPRDCESRGFSVAQAGLSLFVISVQPFADVVADYTCQHRDKKGSKTQREHLPSVARGVKRQHVQYNIGGHDYSPRYL